MKFCYSNVVPKLLEKQTTEIRTYRCIILPDCKITTILLSYMSSISLPEAFSDTWPKRKSVE